MDVEQFISKPWRRLLFTSKYYARKHFSGIYNINAVQYSSNCAKATLNMSEYGNLIQMSPVTTNIDDHAITHQINHNNNSIFREKNSNADDNQLQLVTTKLINSPKKGTVEYFNLNISNLSRKSGPEDVEIIKESDTSNQSVNAKKNSVIKIKVKFIKDKDAKSKSKHSSEHFVEIDDKIIDNNAGLVDLSELNVIAELYAKKNFENNFNISQKVHQPENFLEEIITQEDSEVVLVKETKPEIAVIDETNPEEDNTKIIIAKENIPEVPRLQTITPQLDTPEKNKNCIFAENICRPLSPIQRLSSPSSLQFQAVEDLIQYHEREVLRNNPRRSLSPKTLPRMGTSALFNNKISDVIESLSDPEIISAMVRDRFIVNMYESRCSKQQDNTRRARASTFGRIYKSLERAVATPDKNEDPSSLKNQNGHIIRIQQSSPIQLEDQHVSLNSKQKYTKQLSLDEDDLFGNSTRQFFNLEEESTFQNKLDEIALKVLAQNDIIINKLDTSNQLVMKQKEEDNGSREEQCVMIDFREEYMSNSTLAEEDNTVYLQSHYSDIEEKNGNFNQSAKYYEQIQKPCDNFTTSGTESSYNMEEFLEKALGEELNKYDSQIDSTNDSESKENVTTSLEPKQYLQEDSICTSDASDLISKINTFQSNFYRSLTKKLQHMTDTLRISSAPKHDLLEKTADVDNLEMVFPNNERVTELVRQAAVQYAAMKQITKALTVCRNTKEFAVSSEQVEGERLLLVATYKRQAILDEIRRLDYEVEDQPNTTETGSLLISDLTLPLKEEFTEPIPAKRDHNKWYVCIFSFGPYVFASQPTMARINGSVRFPEEVLFSELPSDFSINIEVFCLLQRKTCRNFSHESKFHINQDEKKSHCPSPKKFLQREKHAQKIPARFDTGVRTSSFKPCGSLKIRVNDLSNTSPWYMRKVPLCSVLNGSVSMTLKSTVQIPVSQIGFLTVGTTETGNLTWNRRWCVLQGHLLKYWNYPCEEDACDPLRIIDLKYCPASIIDIVDRSLCARPRTLLIESYSAPKTKESNIFSLERYFLSADNSTELHNWEVQFNIVVRALRTWNARFVN